MFNMNYMYRIPNVDDNRNKVKLIQ